MNTTSRTRSSGFYLWTLTLAAVAVGLSVLAYVFTRPAFLRFDENYYYPLAQQILGGTYQDGYIVRPPLYPLFLAGVMRLVGTGFGGILLLQSFMRGMLVTAVACLGRRFVSTTAGLLAALLIAIYPLLVWTYSRFVTEILYLPLFVLSFYFLDKAARSERISDTVMAGILSGLATLARSTSLLFTVTIAVWLILRRSDGRRFSKRGFAKATILIVMLLAVISPWTIRNALVHHALIPIDNASAFNLWLITSGKRIEDATPEWTSWGSQAERQREGYRRWHEYLRQDPAFHIKRLATVIPRLFNPGRDPALNSLANIRRGALNRRVGWVKATLGLLIPFIFWLITAGGIAGIALAERDSSRRNLLIITIAYFILLHGMTLARPRFLLPIHCLLAIYSGAFIVWVLTRLGWTRRSHPWRSQP
jgi:4-amino-4-deoxy-L-arabinose transferase-like glycosyltransferase